MVLGPDFFRELEQHYEKSYQLNPSPSNNVLMKLRLWESRARRLAHDLEEIVTESLAGRPSQDLTQEEAQLLEDHVKRASIVESLYPFMVAAYYLTDPRPEFVNEFLKDKLKNLG